jgi:hypothetical protein
MPDKSDLLQVMLVFGIIRSYRHLSSTHGAGCSPLSWARVG